MTIPIADRNANRPPAARAVQAAMAPNGSGLAFGSREVDGPNRAKFVGWLANSSCTGMDEPPSGRTRKGRPPQHIPCPGPLAVGHPVGGREARRLREAHPG